MLEGPEHSSVSEGDEVFKWITENINFLIVTAADAEAEALWHPWPSAAIEELPGFSKNFFSAEHGVLQPSLSVLGDESPKIILLDISGPDFYVGSIGNECMVAHTHLTSQGSQALGDTLSSAVELFKNLKIVYMSGMLGGFHSIEGTCIGSTILSDNISGKYGQKMGDIVICDSVFVPESKKPIKFTSNIGNRIFQKYSTNFKNAVKTINIHCGPILCVPEVIREHEERERLRERYGINKDKTPLSLGFEMESKALLDIEKNYAEQPHLPQIYTILAKSISDWGVGKPEEGNEGRKEHEKERAFASRSSILFLIYLLSQKNAFNFVKDFKKKVTIL
ncbi:hypothetical protein [Armatimonas rosea]|uniref:Uncharacterized protein n=1 Tax=Armatimonas rosea TaxID=685828 RepID=A0A7W9SQ45_ARMRO|nr:hypothetical protein [Armatimonas rosea]MBB6050765.1 hypothetical protein [Armatimonas rosea]